MSSASLAGDGIPISLITGFLGSGKTTVINALLRHPGLSGVMVIVNEFGEIGLDHDLIESATEDLVLLRNGCLCCTVRADLVETLGTLFDRRQAGQVRNFDRVLIETTGLADPAPILHTLMTDSAIAAHFRLDGVITTVDAATGMSSLDRQPESVKQAAMADRLLLTKTDLCDGDTLAALRDRLHRLNPAAPILVARQGEIDPAQVLDAGLYDPRGKTLDVQGWLRAEAYAAPAAHGHHPHDVNRHDEHIRAVCLTLDQPVDGAALDQWLEALLLLKGPDLLRIKGIVNAQGLPGPVVIHGVQHIFHPPVFMDSWPSEDRRTRIVFIARDIDEAMLRDTLRLFTPIDPAPADLAFHPVDSGAPGIVLFEVKRGG